MSRVIIDPSNKDYANFATNCTTDTLRVEVVEVDNSVFVYGLEDNEKLENGVVVSRVGDQDYINKLKEDKLYELERFDKSTSVNEFFINHTSIWLDKATRMGIRANIEDARINGDMYVDIWSDNTKFDIPTESCSELIRKVEAYAKRCFDATAQHKGAIMAMQEAAAIEDYDFRVGYPDKVRFELRDSES